MLVVFKILSALLFMLYTFISSQLILGEKKKINKNLLFLFLIFFIAYYFIIFHINEMLFSLALTFLSIIFIKMYFDKDMISITIFSLVINLIRVLVKASFLFVSNSYMYKIFLFTDYTFLKFIINLFSILISLILIFILKKFIVKFIEKSFKCNHFYIEILSFFIINFILAIFFRYPINDLNIYNLIDSILFLSMLVGFLYLLDRDSKLNSISRYYAEVFEYSRLSDEINFDYRKKVHENKNQLLIIKSMLSGSKKKEINKYIDELLENHNSDIRNYWISDLSYIPFSGIKNFLNHKLIELHELGASIEVYVSSEIENTKSLNLSSCLYNDLNTILGVVLDNMIESLKEMNVKLASINIYIEDNIVYGEFANNFDGYIDIDKLFKLGYTTKGGGHGVCLTLVKDITRKSEKLGCKPSIIDNFFIQTVTLKLDEVLENTKNH